MKTVRPNHAEPIAGPKPPGMGTIILRFAALLAIAIAILTLAWNR